MTSADAIPAVAARLLEARRVLAITGAGISADSGLPTYRGVAGLYAHGGQFEGTRPEEILSAATWRADPGLCWRFMVPLALAVEQASPNRAHRALHALSRTADVLIATQNIDGLHTKAGSQSVVELHGCLHRLRCEACGSKQEVPSFDGLAERPPCARCNAQLRPDVVLFDEFLDPSVVGQLETFVAQPVDVVLVVGTTAQFAYVVQPILFAQSAGAFVVEINPEPMLDRIADASLTLGAADAFGKIGDELARRGTNWAV